MQVGKKIKKMQGITMVQKTLRAKATVAVATNYWPSSSGFDTQIVGDKALFTIGLESAGAGSSSTLDADIEIKFEGSGDWVKTDSFTQVTSSASHQFKSPTAVGQLMRVKLTAGTATAGLTEIVANIPVRAFGGGVI